MRLRLISIRGTTAALLAAFSLNISAETTMFNESDFSRLKFLEGRWKGVGPDGKEFYEEYVLAEPTLLRSLRYADTTFNKATDGSTVTLTDGEVTSTWGEFTWRATSLTPSKACFEPVNAPSEFCWESAAPDSITVTQRWTDADGKEQSFGITLERVEP
jgi:hypothetical protein